MTCSAVARERRHTLYFLDSIRAFSPVFIDADVDMSHVLAHRAAARREGTPYSLVSYVLHAAGRVLAAHPAANAAIRGRIRPKVACYREVNAKLTLDKVLNGQRVVLATVLPSVHAADLDEIQRYVNHFRDGDAATMSEFANVRLLHRLPWPAGPLLFRAVTRSLARRKDVLGTLAVTSLGHRPVNGFHSVGGTTITLGIGHVADRPVVREGTITIAPVMQLNLAFDHRVIDGGEAADVLASMKSTLESFGALVNATREEVRGAL
jgi:hypothetical protein